MGNSSEKKFAEIEARAREKISVAVQDYGDTLSYKAKLFIRDARTIFIFTYFLSIFVIAFGLNSLGNSKQTASLDNFKETLNSTAALIPQILATILSYLIITWILLIRKNNEAERLNSKWEGDATKAVKYLLTPPIPFPFSIFDSGWRQKRANDVNALINIMDNRKARLQQIESWIQEDPAFEAYVENIILKKSSNEDLIYSIVFVFLSIAIGLIGGILYQYFAHLF